MKGLKGLKGLKLGGGKRIVVLFFRVGKLGKIDPWCQLLVFIGLNFFERKSDFVDENCQFDCVLFLSTVKCVCVSLSLRTYV